MFEQMQAENEQAKEIVSQLHAEGHIEVDEHGQISASKRKSL